jgi:adenylate kinase
MNIVFLGSPGSGKGYYAQFLTSMYGIPHISTGHLLREEVSAGTELGKEVEGLVASGLLVPDDIMIKLLKKRLALPDAKKGFFLDGFPRTIAQAKEFEIFGKVDKVINFEADDDVIVQRLSDRLTCRSCGKIYHASSQNMSEGDSCECGGELYRRDDDHESKVRARLKEYEEKTKPLIDWYSKKGLLVRVHHNEPLSQSKEAFLAKVRPHLG